MSSGLDKDGLVRQVRAKTGPWITLSSVAKSHSTGQPQISHMIKINKKSIWRATLPFFIKKAFRLDF
jgi:hypothetical protein